MRELLVFSHAAVLEVNRDLFYRVSEMHEVALRIVCPESWRGDLIRNLRCEPNTRFPKVQILPLPVWFAGNGSIFRYRSNLKALFRDSRPDLVFVDEEPWSLACHQIYRTFPNAKMAFYTKQNIRKRVPFPFCAFQQSVFRQSAFCFSVSEEVSEVLRWKGYRGPIHYLPHSFDPERFQPVPTAVRAETRRGLGLSESSCVVGYFGRLEPEKGIDDLCRAIDALDLRLNPGEVEFLIVGNGSQEVALRAENPSVICTVGGDRILR